MLSTVTGPSQIDSYPFSETVRELSDTGVRGESGMTFLALLAQRFESELREARRHLAECRERVEETRESYFEAKNRISVLEERLSGEEQFRTARRLMISVGGVLGGIGVPRLVSTGSGLGWTLAGFSLVLLLAGWIIPVSSDTEEGA